MTVKVNVVISAVTLFFVLGCSSYTKSDYGDPHTSKKESICINMEPAQEMKCKEREDTLLISLGADKNCNHPYPYEQNRCKREQAWQKKALAESLKKHSDK